ncbi:PadR family transcriptional regulator [Sphingomonas sp. RS2018]
MRGRRDFGPFSVQWDMSGPHGGGGHGGPRGRRRVVSGQELRLVLLKLIADRPRHGYDLIREIDERTGGEYAPSAGVVYPTLTMLSDMDLIGEQPSDDAKKVYAITDTGRDYLERHADEVAGLLARLEALGTSGEKTRSGPVMRAMGNLRQVLRHRLREGEVPTETAHAIADILDDAARRIERL